MKKVKIAQIGIGHDHAGCVMDSLLRQKELFEVAGFCVCKGEEEQYEACKDGVYSKAKRLSLEELLNTPGLDAVSVECNEKILTEHALLAVEKGLPVHMDKPGSEDPENYEKLMRTAKAKGLTVHLGYMYRYNPAVLRLMDIIQSGSLGEIYSVEAHMDCLHPAGKRQWLGQFPGGMMFFLGCHLVDLILRLQGIPEEIIPYNTSTGFGGVSAQDYGMAVFRYPNGISFAKTCAAEPGGFLRRQLVVCGEKGTVEIKPFESFLSSPKDEKNQMTDMSEIYKEEAEKGGWGYGADRKEYGPYNRYDAMMSSFAVMVRGEKKNPFSYEYEVLLHRVLLNACGVKVDYKQEIIL